MKHFIYLCIFLLPGFCFSQKTFAPLNTVWNYEDKSTLNPSTQVCSGNHFQFRVDEEVLIDGKNCSVIKAYRSTGGNPNFTFIRDSLIVFEDKQKIYFQQDTQFLLLFDFGATTGDTIVRYDPFNKGIFSGTLYTGSDTVARQMKLVVDTIEFVNYSGLDLLTQKVYILNYGFHNFILGVGAESSNLSGIFFSETADGCNSRFVCYTNDSISYETANSLSPPHPGCSGFTDSVEDEISLDFRVFPNPVFSELRFAIDLDKFEVRLIDIEGKVVRQDTNTTVLEAADLATGVYFLQVLTEGRTYTKKVVKL